MLKKHDTLFQTFGASPFRPRLMSLYLVGHHPIRSKGAYSSRPDLNETVRFSERGLNGSPLGSEGEKSRGDTNAGAPRPYGIKEQGHCRLTTVTCHFKDSGYATLPGSNGESDSGGLL
jgi:hypothetical protein